MPLVAPVPPAPPAPPVPRHILFLRLMRLIVLLLSNFSILNKDRFPLLDGQSIYTVLENNSQCLPSQNSAPCNFAMVIDICGPPDPSIK
jgi:hypothetical protein